MDGDPALPDPQEDAMDKFVYTPLEPGQFRRLDLHPGSPSDGLICSLYVEPLGHNSFTAVSYCWEARNGIVE
jgi:hypothetical protein